MQGHRLPSSTISVGERWNRIPDEIDEELTLDPVTMYDSGKYFCLVSNQVNAEKSDAVDLEVLPSSGRYVTCFS